MVGKLDLKKGGCFSKGWGLAFVQLTPPNVHNCSCYKQPPKIGSGDIGISSILSTHNVHCATAHVLCTKNIIVNLSIRSIFNLNNFTKQQDSSKNIIVLCCYIPKVFFYIF